MNELYAIVGGSLSTSLVPDVHNAAFRALGLSALCVRCSTPNFADFWGGDVATRDACLRGLTVVRPHKEAALSFAADVSERARGAGAANVLVRGADGWHADTTTCVVDPLRAVGLDPTGCSAAVIGCGGAGCAVAQGLRDLAAADVQLVNRGRTRGDRAHALLGLPCTSLDGFSPHGFDLVVNATPLVDEPVVDVAQLSPHAIVVDLAYRRESDTALVAAARAAGHPVLDGRQVLLSEVGRQFELFVHRTLPPEAVRVALGPRRRVRATLCARSLATG